ncbi:MAG: amidohydrolase family protein [Bacteroidota bacterium]
MRLPLLIALMALFTGCSAEKSAMKEALDNGEVYAFKNVHVVPMDAERIMENQTVLVVGDRIHSISDAASAKIPDGAQTIAGDGKYLMPGLAEMHGHIPPPNQSDAYIASVLFMYVANGITTVRGMLGHDGQLAIKARANASEIISPTLYLAGPSFNGGSVNSPEEAVEKVKLQKAEGWDLLKVHPGLTREEFDAMAETANELDIRFGGHVPAEVGLAHAIAMGQETFDHLDGYAIHVDGTNKPASDEAIAEVVKLTVDSGAWVVPTMVLWEHLYGVTPMEAVSDLPELKYMPRQIVASWMNSHRSRLANPGLDLVTSGHRIENRNRILRALNEGGARILMGTDAPQQFSVPGFSIHIELARMADAGMSPFEIFRTGSVYVGDYFKEQDTFGLVAAGHRADLVLLDKNPLENVGNLKAPAGVMTRGRWLSAEDIEAELSSIAARVRG